MTMSDGVLSGRSMGEPGERRRPRLLILSFSPIVSDARVLKQVRLFSADYEVTTCGYGEAPEDVARHVRVPDELVYWRLDHPLLIARRFAKVQSTQEVVAWAREHLVPGDYDVVLADDVDTVPLALWLRPVGGVHADLHEYAPRQKESVLRWRVFVAPYIRWLVRTFVTRADSVTTVAEGLAEAYRDEYGIDAGVVTNATPYREAEPETVTTGPGRPLRLVHSGAALPDRHLGTMVEAVARTSRDVTLDLYLARNDLAVIEDLRRQAAQLPEGRVRVMDPVPYAQLIDTLARYDVGIYSIPPVSFNHLHSLPNKFFDFIQARLALVISPNPEMARLVREHSLGLISEDYTAESFARALDQLDDDTVNAARLASHRAAHALSAEEQVGVWRRAVAALARRAAQVDPAIELAPEDRA